MKKSIIRRIYHIAVVLFIIAFPPSCLNDRSSSDNDAGAAGITYYIDYENGNDSNNGTSPELAFKHCPGDEKAEGSASDLEFQPGDSVLFRGGIIYRGSIRLTGNGSGSGPVTYKGDGWGDGRAVIDGSEILDSAWTPCGSQADCGDNPDWQNIWYLNAPEGFSFFQAIYQDDELLFFSQHPNQADPFYFDRIEEFREIPFENTAGIAITPASITDPEIFTQSDPDYWNGSYALIWVYPNITEHQPITGFDPATHTIYFNELEQPLYTDRSEYYSILNHISLIDMPGEYSCDPAANRIYLWPFGSLDPAECEFTISQHSVGFDISGRGNIIIEGFIIQKYFANFREWNGGAGITNLGGEPVNITIRNNEIRKMRSLSGASALTPGSADGALVENNYVHDNQRNIGILGSGRNIIIQNNTVSRTSRQGIWFMGARDSQITGNTVTDIKGCHSNGISIYLNSSNILVAGNTVFDANSPLTYEQSADLFFINNLIAGPGEACVHEWGDDMTGVVWFCSNTLIKTGGYGAALSIGESRGAEYIITNNIMGGGPFGANITRSNNIYTELSWSQDARYGWKLEDGEFIADAGSLFVSAEERDYRLRAGSPAIDCGRPVDVINDIENNPRPCGSGWDIGAYEYR